MQNPLGPRICSLFEEGSDLTFARFVQTLSSFAVSAPKEEKLRMIFRLYDVDGDGLVSETDLKEIVSLLLLLK